MQDNNTMSSTSNANIPLDYNPFVQNFTLIQGDGQPILIPMAEVDHFRLYGVRLAINYGSQIGASAILLLVLLLLTKSEKRRSWIFIMNALCLFLNTVRSILQCTWLTGNQYNIYSQLTGDATHDTWHDHANTVASNTMTLLLVICVMVSLSMQVWVVCITTPMIQRIIIMVTTSIIALIAIGYRFAVAAISNALVFSNGDMYSRRNLLVTMTIFQAVAIWAYCVVFMFKLGYALIQRRKLGMTQFGPMQIIFIMGAQTMFIPGALPSYSCCPTLLLIDLSCLQHPSILRCSPRTRFMDPHRCLHLSASLCHLGWCYHRRLQYCVPWSQLPPAPPGRTVWSYPTQQYEQQ